MSKYCRTYRENPIAKLFSTVYKHSVSKNFELNIDYKNLDRQEGLASFTKLALQFGKAIKEI